jgi:hypothetical protein
MLKAVISISGIDYSAVADAVMPAIAGKKGGESGVLAMLKGLFGKSAATALRFLPQGAKDDLVVGMIRKNRPQIIEKVNGLLKESKVAAAVDCMAVERRGGVEVSLVLVPAGDRSAV